MAILVKIVSCKMQWLCLNKIFLLPSWKCCKFSCIHILGCNLLSGSCHIRRVETVVELWIFVFFQFFSWPEIRLKKIQTTLIELWSFSSFKLRHLNSLKVSQNAKFGWSFLSAENQKKTKIPSSTTISTHRIWHEPDIYPSEFRAILLTGTLMQL